MTASHNLHVIFGRSHKAKATPTGVSLQKYCADNNFVRRFTLPAALQLACVIFTCSLYAYIKSDFMRILKKLSQLYWRYLTSSEAYARHIGVKIGENCYISTKKWPSEPYLVKIGNNVQLTQDVFVHTHGGAQVMRRQIPDFDVFGKVEIKDWAYIGSGSHIMPGVTIGEGSLIAAGSIVTKSVPAGEVWGGNPAKFICKVSEYAEKNIKYNTNTKGMTSKEKKSFLLSLPNDKFVKK